ncbi:MAG: hypothetical protein ACXABY_34625 [Candidatus Thorarchaeota archaeon]|jgi:hypothetical protein
MSSRKLFEEVHRTLASKPYSVDTFAIHGFSYDPDSGASDNNPNNNFFPHMQARLPNLTVYGMEYYSVPPGVKGVLKSWWHGRWNRYRYAWDLAEEQAKEVASCITAASTVRAPIQFIVHSLGSKVLFDAIDIAFGPNRRNPIKRVIIFNGADHREHVEEVMARHAMLLSTTQFLNVFTRTDKVLSALGGHFAPVEAEDGKHYRHLLGRLGSAHKECIGRAGSALLHNNTDNWRDLDCTFTRYPVDMPSPYNNAVIGDDDDSIGDHSYTFKRVQNWQVFRPFMEGKYQLIRR